MCVWCAYVVHVHVGAGVGAHVHVSACVWRPEFGSAISSISSHFSLQRQGLSLKDELSYSTTSQLTYPRGPLSLPVSGPLGLKVDCHTCLLLTWILEI